MTEETGLEGGGSGEGRDAYPFDGRQHPRRNCSSASKHGLVAAFEVLLRKAEEVSDSPSSPLKCCLLQQRQLSTNDDSTGCWDLLAELVALELGVERGFGDLEMITDPGLVAAEASQRC